MSAPRTVTPNACLLAVLLIVRSASGVSFTFHYPPKPQIDSSPSTSSLSRPHAPHASGGPAHPATAYTDSDSHSHSGTTNSDGGSSGDEDDDRQSRTTLQDIGAVTVPGTGRTATERSDSGSRTQSYAGGGHRRRSRKEEEEEGRKEGAESGGEPPWETVLGFRADFLAGLLAPKASMCRTRFEMTVDDVVFLGFPLHVRPDGTWRKKKKRRRGSGEEDEEEEGDGEGAEAEGETVEVKEQDGEAKQNGYEKEENGNGESEDAEKDHGNDQDHDNDKNHSNDEKDDDEHSSTAGEGMSMFHVVFVLNPPELEYHFRTQEIFDYVVKRFARALKYEQAKDGYVWREAGKINTLREKAVQEGTSFSELWKQILEQSSLAYAMSRIYTDISQSKIAHIFLNDNLGLSLQIPIITETAVLPGLTDPQVPGLPLTTANSFDAEDTEGDSMLARHFTLLFLTDVENILKEIAAETTESSNSFACFVKACKPYLSFLQISNTCSIPLHDIQLMAHHLIHWRKARAIPPIHQRDIFIVSPNADMRRLHTLIPVYARLFPTLPTLPIILSKLSVKPKPYHTYIPSRDHRSAYLEILAWLIRHGLVTQLRNFAWIRATRAIKVQAAREMAARERDLARKRQLRKASGTRSRSVSPGPGSENERDKMTSSISSLLSLGLPSPGIPEEIFEEPDIDDERFTESIILEPHQASAVESAWLEMMMRDQPSDLRALFDRIMKYLNGQHAIEKISVREGISRRDVRRVLSAFDEYLVYVSTVISISSIPPSLSFGCGLGLSATIKRRIPEFFILDPEKKIIPRDLKRGRRLRFIFVKK